MGNKGKTKKRIHVYYSGRVQGIGFRYTALDVAQSLGIVGWVKNLRDGRVEVVCEGKGGNLKKFLEEIANGPLKYYIQDTDVIWEVPTGEFTKFDITF